MNANLSSDCHICMVFLSHSVLRLTVALSQPSVDEMTKVWRNTEVIFGPLEERPKCRIWQPCTDVQPEVVAHEKQTVIVFPHKEQFREANSSARVPSVTGQNSATCLQKTARQRKYAGSSRDHSVSLFIPEITALRRLRPGVHSWCQNLCRFYHGRLCGLNIMRGTWWLHLQTSHEKFSSEMFVRKGICPGLSVNCWDFCLTAAVYPAVGYLAVFHPRDRSDHNCVRQRTLYSISCLSKQPTNNDMKSWLSNDWLCSKWGSNSSSVLHFNLIARRTHFCCESCGLHHAAISLLWLGAYVFSNKSHSFRVLSPQMLFLFSTF